MKQVFSTTIPWFRQEEYTWLRRRLTAKEDPECDTEEFNFLASMIAEGSYDVDNDPCLLALGVGGLNQEQEMLVYSLPEDCLQDARQQQARLEDVVAIVRTFQRAFGITDPWGCIVAYPEQQKVRAVIVHRGVETWEDVNEWLTDKLETAREHLS